jgi:hypothetical protein
MLTAVSANRDRACNDTSHTISSADMEYDGNNSADMQAVNGAVVGLWQPALTPLGVNLARTSLQTAIECGMLLFEGMLRISACPGRDRRVLMDGMDEVFEWWSWRSGCVKVGMLGEENSREREPE